MSAFIEDLNARYVAALVEKFGTSEQTAQMIVAEISGALCADWSGERPYIGKDGAANKMGERNRAIIRDYKNGERICFLVRRYRISRQRIWKIING